MHCELVAHIPINLTFIFFNYADVPTYWSLTHDVTEMVEILSNLVPVCVSRAGLSLFIRHRLATRHFKVLHGDIKYTLKDIKKTLKVHQNKCKKTSK